MGHIKSILGPISGPIDNLVFYSRNGKTIVRRKRVSNSEITITQKLSATSMGLISTYASLHAKTIEHSFSAGSCSDARHAFIKLNYNGLRQALLPLAHRKVNGETICHEEIEEAVSTFAAEHPHEIYVAYKQGFEPVHLTGEWPAEIVLKPVEANAEPVKVQNFDGTLSNVVSAKERKNTVAEDWMADLPDNDDTSHGETPVTQCVITTNASPAAGGTVTGGGSYAQGTQVTLKATANSGYTFSRWSDGNTSAQRTVTASANTTYTAEFTQNSGSGGGSQGGYDSGN